jgi:thiamine biosynthesis lipoprotein
MSATNISASFPAFGSTATVVVTDPAGLQDACDAVAQTVDDFDLACSRFREDSELMALNRANGAVTRVGPVLLDALSAAVRAARLTDGDVDPALGDALIALGYDRDFELLDHDRDGGRGFELLDQDRDDGRGFELPHQDRDDGREFGLPHQDRDDGREFGLVHEDRDDGEPASRDRPGAAVRRPGARRHAPRVAFASVAGWRTIRIDRAAATVSMGRGITLDLGATAKALAADRAAAQAARVAGCGVLVSLGGDIALHGAAPLDGWRVRVTDDHRADLTAPGQWITLRTGGLATSSTTVRRWRQGAASVHHLLDPASGRPAPAYWRTVSVAAATCLDANIATTAAIVRGARAVQWLQSLALPSRLVIGDDLRCYRAADGARVSA